MKIFSAAQQREIDHNCILQEPISSIDLMERASLAFFNVFKEKFEIEKTVDIFCGAGNNAGDGLAIARMLFQNGYDIRVYLSPAKQKSADFEINLKRLAQIIPSSQLLDLPVLHTINPSDIAIDGLFGTGLNRSLNTKFSSLCEFINDNYIDIVSIDVPSGMYADKANDLKDIFIKPSLCISFHAPKLCFLMDESGKWIKEWVVVDIGISKEIDQHIETIFHLNENGFCEKLVIQRDKFAHKGTFGHGILWAGSKGMFGAAILSSKAAMRTGIGKLSVYSAEIGHDILQISVPEAMFCPSSQIFKKRDFSAIAFGPGLGLVDDFEKIYNGLLHNYSHLPWLIDADGINMLAKQPNLLNQLPQNCIFTPHPKELERLTGIKAKNRFHQIELAKDFCQKHRCTLLLKGAYTAICNKNGEVFFNINGNPGMATAGSGDVLSGIILALLSQGMAPLNAAILGAYLHGKAGDKALKLKNELSLIASDIIENL